MERLEDERVDAQTLKNKEMERTVQDSEAVVES